MTDHKIKAKVLFIPMSYVASFCSVSPIAEKSRLRLVRAPATILSCPDRTSGLQAPATKYNQALTDENP